MDADLLKRFRINLLTQLRAAGRHGMLVSELMLNARVQGFTTASDNDVREEIDYLIDKNHAEKLPQEISPEVESFRATAAGRDWLATQNL